MIPILADLLFGKPTPLPDMSKELEELERLMEEEIKLAEATEALYNALAKGT